MSAEKFIECCKKQKWIKYKWGGELPSTGFDCSGLVVYCYKQATGKTLPHYTGDLVKRGTRVTRNNLKAGDLIFPSDHHVGVFIGNGQFIHAPHTGDSVKISQVTKFYAGRRIF